MSVYLRSTTRSRRLDLRGLERVTEVLLAEIGESGASVALSLVGDAAIRRMNREYRGTDRATDVLSFPLFAAQKGDPLQLNRRSAYGSPPPTREARGAPFTARKGERTHPDEPERLLGDVVISVDAARRQAANYDATLDAELRRLLIHGVLHLVGHDHEEATERARMEAEERRLAAAIGLAWPF